VLEVDGALATVLVGEFDGTASPVRRDTAQVGLDVVLPSRTTSGTHLPLQRDFEYAVIVLEGAVTIGTASLIPGRLGYVDRDHDELVLVAEEPSRLLLLGGEPFGEQILMWWNFVGRSREEMNDAYQQWQAGNSRFGRVTSSLTRIPAPRPPWLDADAETTR
jgi:quercetin 2,3-dioxygenase